MTTVTPGDWFQSKGNPSAFLEVLTVNPDGGVRVRMGGQEANTTKRYLLQNYAHIEADS